MKNPTGMVNCGIVIAGLFLASSSFAQCAKDYVGRWALTLPGGGAGWLGVEQKACGELNSALLWGGGSVVPTSATKFEEGVLKVTRIHKSKKEGKETVRTETITAKVDGCKLALNTRTVDQEGKEVGKAEFSGKRIPDLPAKPDLAKVKFGTPIPLLNGTDLTGWVAMNPKAYNGWSIHEGCLINRVMKPDGGHHNGTNLRTEKTFEDFNLKAEVNMSKNGNSGIYLRGIYEIQMLDSYGKPLDSHHMGALYSRITPSVSAEKPAGEWQTVDITLCDRHVTVILNGVTIIDNQPALGCTGGALTADEFVAGPIYLQGDHTDVSYRNMVLTPIIK